MTSLFDETVFKTLRSDLGDEDTAEALNAFLADTAFKMARLAANGEARALIRQEAHAIKSSAGTFGFLELSRLARELEFAAATLDSPQLRDLTQEFRTVFQSTRQLAEANLLDQSAAIAK